MIPKVPTKGRVEYVGGLFGPPMFLDVLTPLGENGFYPDGHHEYPDRIEWWNVDDWEMKILLKNPDIVALAERHGMKYLHARSVWTAAANSNMPLDDFARACLSGKGTFGK